MQRRATDWFQKHKIKAFYSFVDGENFESGSRALMQASGIGKLKPNILLMGYKTNWRTCDRTELDQYFNTIHKVITYILLNCYALLYQRGKLIPIRLSISIIR